MSMKAILVAVLFVTVGWSVSRPGVAAPGQDAAGRADKRRQAMEKFDANGNGRLDPEEREAARAAMQKRRADGGGKGPAGAGADPERRRKMLERFDKDGDGKLSESERAAAKEPRPKPDR
jgi:hypothetical protein